MKAIRVHQYGEPEVMIYEEVADLQPGAGQVLVHLTAIGVNPVETYQRSGAYPALPQLPYTPGTDGAGTVRHIGEDVNSIQIGERVYVAGSLSGTYAEYALCGQDQAHALPSSVTDAQGAGVGVPYATAYRALFQRARAVAGETVLVHGASGGVGIAAVQLARAAGLKVIGTAGTEDGEQSVRDQGAQFVLNHRAPDYLKRVTDITEGRGVNVIIEMLANVNLGKDPEVLAKYGRVVVVGSRGRTEIDPRAAMGKDASILGMSMPNAAPDEVKSIHAALAAGLENGTLRPVIGQEFPLAEAPRAHHAIIEGNAHGKIILLP